MFKRLRHKMKPFDRLLPTESGDSSSLQRGSHGEDILKTSLKLFIYQLVNISLHNLVFLFWTDRPTQACEREGDGIPNILLRWRKIIGLMEVNLRDLDFCTTVEQNQFCCPLVRSDTFVADQTNKTEQYKSYIRKGQSYPSFRWKLFFRKSLFRVTATSYWQPFSNHRPALKICVM